MTRRLSNLDVSQPTVTVNTSTNEQEIQSGTQVFPSPIFNIHIHVPPTKAKNVQVYLPKIQPVIHLHFEKLAKKLEIHNKGNEEATYRIFHDLLAMTSPQFGNVLFHEYNERNESKVIEPNTFKTIEVSPESNLTDTVLENQPNGIYGCSGVNEQSEKEHSHVTGQEESPEKNVTRRRVSPRISVKRCNPSTEESQRCKLKKDSKLTKAVVVLTDVTKTKYFRDMVAAKKIWLQSKDDGESSAALGESSYVRKEEKEHLEEDDFERISIKQEIDNFSPESSISITERKFEIGETDTPFENSMEMESPSNSMENNTLGSTQNSLTALAEGCNFSDILNRFRLKYNKEYLGDHIKFLDEENTGECSTPSGSSREDWHAGRIARESSEVVRPKEEPDSEEWGDVDEDTFNNSSENSLKITDMTVPAEDQSGGLQETPSGSKSDIESDTEKVQSVVERKSASARVNGSEIEIITSCTSPYLVPISRFKYIKKEKNFEDVSDLNFQLKLIRKEMKRRRLENKPSKSESARKKKAPEAKSPSTEDLLPKRKKRSESRNDEDKAEMAGSGGGADYIPLQANGPTKFSVAPLDRVSSYENHPARNFREEMLFGNRVNRFPNSQELRVYQLKRRAVRNQSS